MSKRVVAVIFVICGLFYFVAVAFADWGPAKRLTWNLGNSCDPAAALDSNNHIHIVWDDETPGNAEIYYKKSTDEGASWSANKRLTWNSGGSHDPAIAIDSTDAIHVAWCDYTSGSFDIYYKKSTDGGANWSANKRLTYTSTGTDYPSPAMAIDSNDHIHIAWYLETPNANVYYKRSADGGASWGPAQRLTWTSGSSGYPAITVDVDGHILIAWQYYTPGTYDIYCKKSTDGGASWGPAQRLTWTSGSSAAPHMAVSSNNFIHLVWTDDSPGNWEIFLKKSQAGGTSWGPAQRLTWNSGDSYEPVIAAESTDTFHVVWWDQTPGSYEVFYKKSQDGGSSWSAAKRLTWTPGWSGSPALALDRIFNFLLGCNVHVVWHDDTPGNYEIYYRKGK